jgi:KipI family sensor histidine kinase inhibitor
MLASNAIYPRAIACGDSGVSIEFGNAIDPAINERVLSLDAALSAAPFPGLIETVPTYRALMIHYDPVEVAFDEAASYALAIATRCKSEKPLSRSLKIPVCYEGEHGLDVDRVCSQLGLTRTQLIDLHTASEYRVYMLGFMPGFAYLGGTNPALSLPRLGSPRHGAPAGTISVAAGQCAVHAVEGPSGWHWIGRTPAESYRQGINPEFGIHPGDQIRFYPISQTKWRHMRREALAGADFVEVVQ